MIRLFTLNVSRCFGGYLKKENVSAYLTVPGNNCPWIYFLMD